MMESFEDELDDEIRESMKDPEYWDAHMASCDNWNDCRNEFHIPDPRWEKVWASIVYDEQHQIYEIYIKVVYREQLHQTKQYMPRSVYELGPGVLGMTLDYMVQMIEYSIRNYGKTGEKEVGSFYNNSSRDHRGSLVDTPNILEDTKIPEQFQSKALMEPDIPSALAYLKRVNAEDCIDALGLRPYV